MLAPVIQKLINLFSKFPTVGSRTASRFVFYLLKLSEEELKNLISAISNLKKEIKLCKFCFNPFQVESLSTKDDGTLCKICANPLRNKNLLCVVEKEVDLITIEKIKKYNGLFFILGGTISALKKPDIKKLRIKELEERIKNNPNIQEIIMAINPTAEGEATTLYLERLLKSFEKKITRLGRGLPVGAELEYADEETLSSALEGRR